METLRILSPKNVNVVIIFIIQYFGKVFIGHTLKISGVQCCFEPNFIQNIEKMNTIQEHIWYSKIKLCVLKKVDVLTIISAI